MAPPRRSRETEHTKPQDANDASRDPVTEVGFGTGEQDEASREPRERDAFDPTSTGDEGGEVM